MKKRLVAIVLSVTMCFATVLEAGAASMFTSPDSVEATLSEESADSVSGEEVQPEETADTEATDNSGDEAVDVFTSGEEDGFTEAVTDVAADELPETDSVTDVFSAAEEENVTVPAAAAGGIVVDAEDWETDGKKFRLRKAAPQAAEAAEVLPAEETELPAAELLTGEAEDASDVQEASLPEEDTAGVEPTEEVPVSEEAAQEEAQAVSDYYTAADGLLQITTDYKNVTHTGYYLFDAEGYLVTGKKAVKAGTNNETADTEYYFADETNAVVYKEFKGEAVNPCSSNLGQQLRGSWAWTGSAFRYYDENGRYMTVAEVDKLYKQKGLYTGYYEIYGEYFCLNASGTPKTGNIVLTTDKGSFKYYFQPAKGAGDIPGKMFHGGWRTMEGPKGQRWLYYNQGVTKPEDVGKLLERGVIATKLDGNVDPDIDPGKTYLIDSYGYIQKSKMVKAQNGAYYCTDSRGVIYKKKLVKYNNARYYFGDNGQRVTWKNSWRKCPGASNRYYYFGSTPGKVSEKKGWQKVTTTAGKFYGWFYFNANGNHYMDTITSAGYYFNAIGKLAGGIQEVKGKKYLFEPSDEKAHKGKMYKSTLIYYKNKWYYAGTDGALRKSGWQSVKGNWYYFDNYRAVTKKFMKKNGVNGYLDSTGKYTTGWVIVSNAKNTVKFIDPDGNGFVKNGSKWINGLLYYFDANGYRINDLTNIYGGPYYVKVDRKNGVMTVYNSAKTVPVKSIRVSVGNPWTPTPTGTYTLRRSQRWQPLMGPSWGQYGTHVSGAGQGGIFVHSVSGGHADKWSLPAGEYNKLGNPASHGCIRVCVADAKWVYDNCNGATITIFDGTPNSNEAMKGPLGRRPLVPLRAPYNFDPTDPEI